MPHHIDGKQNLKASNDRLTSLLDKGVDLISGLGPDFEHKIKKLSALKDRLMDGRFHLAVLGQFKRGKSTLLNALISEPILPVSVVPLTSVPTFIHFGSASMIRVRYGDNRSVEEFSGASTSDRTDFLVKYVTEEGNPKNKLGVTEVEVVLPAPILSKGVVLIDTPGIGSTYRHNTQATLNFLQQCDAALFLISADPPITDVELDFLRQVRQKIPRLFFILNKVDYLNAKERDQVLAFFREILAEHLDIEKDIPVFSISARKGLEAKVKQNKEQWIESGVAELETYLVDFLVREKFSAMCEAISRRATDAVVAALMGVRISLQALHLPQKTLEEKLAVFEKSLHQADQDRMIIQDILEGDKKRMTAFIEDRSQALRKEARAFLEEEMNRGLRSRSYGKSTKSSVQDAWAESIPDFFEHKQAELNEDVKSHLLDALAPHEQRTDQLIETLRKTAADLFQVPYRSLHHENALETARRPYWVLNTWNTDAIPMLKSMDQRLDDLVRRNVENLRWSTMQNVNISFARFASRVKERLEETVAATQGAMKTARFRKKDHGETVAEAVCRLEKVAGELETLKAGLEN
ncbi:MAG: dynamin family protein [Desulfobacterales bacterium]|jgi:ribosome biogenesis GTPase A